MDVEEYLERKRMGYENLSEEERRAISNFALIWSLFEAQLLEENASARKIIEKCTEWHGSPNSKSGLGRTRMYSGISAAKSQYAK